MSTQLRRWICGVLAAGVLVAGCGGTSDEQRSACDSGVSGRVQTLTYQGQAGLAGVVGVLCERLDGLDIGYRVQLEGSDRVLIEVARGDVSQARAAAVTGQLAFYDWEPLVIGPDGQPAPTDPRVTGGAGAGQAAALTLYDAIQRAKDRPAKAESDNSHDAPVYFAVDPNAEKVYGPAGADSRREALAAVPASERKDAVVHAIKPDTVIVRAEQIGDLRGKIDRWFVLKDDVALSGSEISNPMQLFDNGPGGSGAPIVAFEFTEKGQRIWQDMTREIAERGSRNVGLLKGQTADAANQHFAIALDDQLVSVPYIDFRRNPDGIDGAAGSQIQGGFTVKSAKQLVSVLRTGALTMPLTPIGSG